MQPTRALPAAGSAVKPGLTPSEPSRRPRRVVENQDFAAFVRRVVRAHARRIGEGDVDALPDMFALAAEIDAAIGQAITGLRQWGYSWADIALRLGISRQAAQQRWGGEQS